MNRQLLEQPFPKELLKTRKGTFGKSFTYVEGAEYIRRLNDAFEGDWSFEVVEHQTLDTEVTVLGKVTCSGITKMAFGGSKITVNREGELVSIADDLKAAATDALKKASSLLGVGLHLYSEPATNASETKRPNNSQRKPQQRGTSRPSDSANGNGANGNGANGNGGNGNGKSNGNGNNTNGNRLTQKQLSCIWGMARSLGRSVEAVRQHTVDAYGNQPEQMSKTDASSLITELGEALSQVSGGAA